ncbi:hypothetical protein MD484_g4725, partial [Candolleomyces efflorescens]
MDSELPLSQLIPLATYLNRLFPRLADVTSTFEQQDKPGKTCSHTLANWKNLDALLKSYQQIRIDHLKDIINTLVDNNDTAPFNALISGS